MSNQLIAAKSFWISERDKYLSLLDILLNKSCATENPEVVQKKINDTILKLSESINSIQTLDNLIKSMYGKDERDAKEE